MSWGSDQAQFGPILSCHDHVAILGQLYQQYPHLFVMCGYGVGNSMTAAD